jgi:hypothetical protein
MLATRNTLALLITSVACLFAGCASVSEPQTQVGTFRGYYTKSFEVSTFAPCGIRQLWWVTGRVDSLISALTSAEGFVGGTIYTEFTGELSRPGRYGHLGAYSREVVVRSVTVARQARADDCQSDRR